MDFYTVLEEVEWFEGHAVNPYASRTLDNKWHSGWISIDFLNTHFGEFDNADDMIKRAKVMGEGTVLYFEWLVEQGILN